MLLPTKGSRDRPRDYSNSNRERSRSPTFKNNPVPTKEDLKEHISRLLNLLDISDTKEPQMSTRSEDYRTPYLKIPSPSHGTKSPTSQSSPYYLSNRSCLKGTNSPNKLLNEIKNSNQRSLRSRSATPSPRLDYEQKISPSSPITQKVIPCYTKSPQQMLKEMQMKFRNSSQSKSPSRSQSPLSHRTFTYQTNKFINQLEDTNNENYSIPSTKRNTSRSPTGVRMNPSVSPRRQDTALTDIENKLRELRDRLNPRVKIQERQA